MRRASSALFWGGLLVLGVFGTAFTFANYPLFGVGVVLLVVLLAAYSERERRRKQRARESARRAGAKSKPRPLERLDAP